VQIKPVQKQDEMSTLMPIGSMIMNSMQKEDDNPITRRMKAMSQGGQSNSGYGSQDQIGKI
jgi:hypothetical protein